MTETLTFGQRLRSLRDARGWSRRKIVLKARGAITYEAIKKLETIPGRKPQKTTLIVLSEVFPELQFN